MVLDMKTGMGQEGVHFCQREHSGLDEAESKYTELKMEHVSHQSGLWTESEGKEGRSLPPNNTHTFCLRWQNITIPQCI